MLYKKLTYHSLLTYDNEFIAVVRACNQPQTGFHLQTVITVQHSACFFYIFTSFRLINPFAFQLKEDTKSTLLDQERKHPLVIPFQPKQTKKTYKYNYSFLLFCFNFIISLSFSPPPPFLSFLFSSIIPPPKVSASLSNKK